MGLFDQFPYTNIHELNLDWVMCQLKRYGIVIDGLPDYINNAIKDQLDDLNLTDIVIDAIAQYGAAINVKAPGHGLTPAKGDGVSDDTQALQAIINYGAQNNLPLLFYDGAFMARSLNVSSGVFLGTDAQIMKIGNTPDPLIHCTGKFKADGLRINGNLTGQSDPETTVQLFGASDVEFVDCEIDGGTSCITGDVSEALKLTNCIFKQYTEYAVQSEGSGFIQSNGCRVDSVASGGALRFMRIDTSNGIVADFISIASVQIGFELTGNFNYISARIPNTETRVNDGGQNNSYWFFGNEEKKSLNGNKLETISGDVTENYGGHNEESSHFHVTAKHDVNIAGTDIVLNPANPVTYKAPIELNKYFNYVPFKTSNEVYKVLVDNGKKFVLNEKIYNIIAFGDSLLEGGGWLSTTLSLLQANRSYNYGKSGAGFIRADPTTNITFQDMLNKAITDLTADEKDEINIVLIGGSINDWITGNDYNAYDAAVSRFLATAKSAFPNALIYGFLPMGCIPRTIRDNLYIRLEKNVFYSSGCGWIDDIENALINFPSLVQSDRIHPTGNGFSKQATYITQHIVNGAGIFAIESYYPTNGYSGRVLGFYQNGFAHLMGQITVTGSVTQQSILQLPESLLIPSIPVFAPAINNTNGKTENNLTFALTETGVLALDGYDTAIKNVQYNFEMIYQIGFTFEESP